MYFEWEVSPLLIATHISPYIILFHITADFGDRFGASPPLLSTKPPEHSRHPIARAPSPARIPLSVSQLNKPDSRDSGYPDWEPDWAARASNTLGRRRSEFNPSPRQMNGFPRGSSITDLHNIPSSPSHHMFHSMSQVRRF